MVMEGGTWNVEHGTLTMEGGKFQVEVQVEFQVEVQVDVQVEVQVDFPGGSSRWKF